MMGIVDEVPWAFNPFNKPKRKTYHDVMTLMHININREIRRVEHKKSKKRRHMVEASRRENRR